MKIESKGYLLLYNMLRWNKHFFSSNIEQYLKLRNVTNLIIAECSDVEVNEEIW